MSYLRPGYLLKYVDGISTDYVYQESDSLIWDYGGISDEGIIELLFLHWKTEDNTFKNHLLRVLAKQLDVKLRDKPLDDEYLRNRIFEDSNRCNFI